MTELRKRMEEAMVLRGLALRTQETYLACVAALARHYGRSPDRIDAAQIQSYLLHLITEKKLAYASVNQAVCALRFFFERVLKHPQVRFDIPMAKVPVRLPQILSREEVARLIGAVGTLRARTLPMTAYAAGLRVSEVCAMQVTDIESAPDRMCLKVRQGKGGQDRYTLLSPRLLDTLRAWWRVGRPVRWLFPNPAGTAPIDPKTAQRIYCAAREAAGIRPEGGIHTLRHCFASQCGAANGQAGGCPLAPKHRAQGHTGSSLRPSPPEAGLRTPPGHPILPTRLHAKRLTPAIARLQSP